MGEGSGDKRGAQSRVQGGTRHPEPPPLPPRFVCRNNGVLFENQLLQIGVKSEFRQNLGASREGWGRVSGRPWPGEGVERTQMEPSPAPPLTGRMYLFYGNKTSVQFQNFSPTVVHPGDLQAHILLVWPGSLVPDPCWALFLQSLSTWYFSEIWCYLSGGAGLSPGTGGDRDVM